MFRRFAYQFQGPEAQGWTPPWLRDDEHGPRFPGMRRERGPFGPPFFWMRRGRGPFGHGPFGPGEAHRFFGRGDLKFALLELLQERPMHGYEMMKALEEKSSGFYAPSPGSIYPTLQMLEDRGLVSVREVEGKKVYSITDSGRAFLAEQQKEKETFFGPPWARARERAERRPFPEMQALKTEAAEVMRLFTIAGRMSLQDPAQLGRLRSIIEHTRKELTDMIYSAGSQPGQSSTASSDQSAAGPSVENV